MIDMKFPILRVTTLLMLCVSMALHAQDANDAGSYLGFIGAQYKEVAQSMMRYSSAAAHGKGARKVEKRRQELLMQIKETERNVRRMKPFHGETRLRDSVVSYFNLCYHVLNEDYGKILNMEDIAEQSYDLMEAYLLAKEKAEEKLDDAGSRAGDEYAAFATANHIKLIEGDSKLSEKMKVVSRVNAYYNQLYLIQFKSFKDEVYFLDAFSRGDVSAMEQSIAALKSSSADGLAKLVAIPNYNGDASIRNSCQELLKFYQRETTTHFPAFVDLELKKENLNKMQKAMQTKRQSDRTQEEINALNAAITDYNNSANKVNGLAAERNKTSTNLLNAWNNRSNEFLDKYTPR